MKHKHGRNSRKEPREQAIRQLPIPSVHNGKPETKNHYGYLAFLLLVLIAPFSPILAAPAGRVLGNAMCDNPSAYYFINYFAAQCWREGTVPLWNPYVMLGFPFLAEGQASVFHPLSFLFVLLPTGTAINWLIAIAFMLTGLSFYGYLRALHLGQPAAWCGAVAWSFSNALVSRIYAGHLNILLTIISMPLVLMFWEKYRAGGGVRHLVGISLGYALMILAFYPQFLYIFSLFFLLYVVIQSAFSVTDRASFRAEVRAILILGAFILLGIGVGAIQLLPSVDFLGRSFRQKATIEFCGVFSFPFENLLTAIAPGFYGTKFADLPGRYWGRNYYWEMWLYLGILPLLMAAAGAWVAPRARRAALLAGAAIFLILGLGKYTPLFPLIYKLVPFFDVFRGPSKNLLITLFCLVTLGAHGFEILFSETDPARRRRAGLIAVAAGASLFLVAAALAALLIAGAQAPGSNWRAFLAWIAGSGEGLLRPVPEFPPELISATAGGAALALKRAMILIALSIGLLLIAQGVRPRAILFPAVAILLLADLLGVFLPMQRTFDESITHFPKEFQQTVESFPYPPRILIPKNALPNIAMRHGYSSPFGYTGNTLVRYNDFINRVQQTDLQSSNADSHYRNETPYYRLLAFDAIAVDPRQVAPNSQIIGRLLDHVLVPYKKGEENIPRAFLAESPLYVSRREEALHYVFSADADVRRRPSIERAGTPVPPHRLDDNETVHFISFKPLRVELEVRASHPRELVLCAMFERNWTAEVNGVRSRVEPANYVFRAVQVPPGTSRVVFEYQPVAFYLGAAVTAVALLILGLIVFFSRFGFRPWHGTGDVLDFQLRQAAAHGRAPAFMEKHSYHLLKHDLSGEAR